MVNNFGEAIATFLPMPETRQIAEEEELNTTNINRKGEARNRKMRLPVNSLFL